ncbi:Putative ribonuclease Z/Hydroxyacylglutathione hydrolase [Colletotrichum destructivum]|uniref:Ribonuclease Z/Hydroxyacylglutathione hydrolase n=1 Tax=Colletotrichum destructivum TaxID=34406 RepID=A0AAX4IYK3_9PEZI|nr:Putative ribonuclease Z/Hydroxyacylglutathione hydrolase [Colletotrichum destructivum]
MDRAGLLQTLASAEASPRRPILTYVNGDNTWLISIPRPDAGASGGGGKAFYHILLDPWLGGHSDSFSKWILRMRLKQDAALGSIGAVEDWIRDTETACGGAKGAEERWWLDAVLITHLNADHLHEPTLRTFDPSISVFAVSGAAAAVSALKHFDNVAVVPDFVRGETWPATPGMPAWLSVFRLQDEKGAYPYIYHAMIIGTSSSSSAAAAADGGKDEVILYTPHGVEPEMVEAAMRANPKASIVAMMHPLNECGVGVISKGVANGLKIERQNGVRHWVNTHDDKLQYTGILGYFMQYGRKTLEQGLEEEAREKGGEQRRPNYVVVGNGGSHILT